MAVVRDKMLGQLRPANTTAASVYTLPNGAKTTIKSIHVCNTSAAQAAFRLFVDDDGAIYDESTAIEWDIVLRVGESFSFDEIFIFLLQKGGSLGVRTNTNNALTFTVFGTELTQ